MKRVSFKKIMNIFLLVIGTTLVCLLALNLNEVTRLLKRGSIYSYSDDSLCKSSQNITVRPVIGISEDSISKARKMISKLKDDFKIPGLSVCIMANDTIILSKSFGCEDLENKIPVTENTKFRVGSIAKSMTGIALMKLVDEGKIDLNKNVTDYWSSFPKKEYPISIKSLASHQSGIRHYKGFEFISNKPYQSVEESLEIFINDKLEFEPGTDYKYSTYNYVLLSRLIEIASNKQFLDFMDNSIFKPLEMNNTVPDYKLDGYLGYSSTPGKDKIKNAVEVDQSNKWAGGGFLSTSKDLVFMMKNIKNLLSEESQKILLSPNLLANGNKTDYGIGFKSYYSDTYKRTLIFHGGSSVGGRAFLLYIPENDITIALCTNSDTGLLMPNNFDLQEVFNILKPFI